MKNNDRKILNKKYHDYQLEQRSELKTILRKEIFNILNKLDNHNSEDFHIWGLIHYMADDDKDKNLNFALEKFIKAYQLDSNNFLACLYIGHCYQDMKELTKALKYYELVNTKELKEFQLWRYVKLLEQIGYCHYKLGKKEIGRKKFQEVLKWYKMRSNEEHLAIPSEIIECLDKEDEIVIEIKKIEDYLK